MSHRQHITVREATANDLALVPALVDLINEVYRIEEGVFWKGEYLRTNAGELEQLLRRGRLLLAEYNGAVVGSIKVALLNRTTAGFGMLVASPEHRGKGIGSLLVRAAEQWAKAQERSQMQLELLTPVEGTHPGKEVLRTWYTRIGYMAQYTEGLAGMHDDKAWQLAFPSNFTVYTKQL